MAKGKLIAVNGPPGSGKTTLSIKLAQEVHEKTKKQVVYISPDTMIPAMGYIFPKREKGSLFSLGAALENVNLAVTDLLGAIATTKNLPNMGYLGYIPGDGPYTYATLLESKVKLMFQLLLDNFDYIFVDCDRNRDDMISSMACGTSDYMLQVINPDIKSLAYYGYDPMLERAIPVLNLLDNDIYLPIQDIKAHFANIQFTTLYSRPLKTQMYNGELMDLVKDPVYRKSLLPLAELITKQPEDEADEATMDDSENAEPLNDDQSADFWE